MVLVAFLIAATMFLAYSNGANDNFKGVATLLGSGTTSYRRALAWATITTLGGLLVAVWLGAALVKSFSGKGLVPDPVTLNGAFLAAVGFGAASTVLLATRFGFPISTTHAMTGALVGAGLVATGGDVSWSKLGASFFVPLLVSPALALLFAAVLYPAFRFARLKLGVTEESSIGLETREHHPLPATASLPAGVLPGTPFIMSAAVAEALDLSPSVVVGKQATLIRQYRGAVIGINAQQILNVAHYLSAGSVSFARGLNDAPKIVALLMAARALELEAGLGLVAVAMAFGGLLSARRIADTMARRITAMNAGQGFTANLVTAMLVIGASKIGVPVSTTHVSCGALFGIGAVNRQARWNVIVEILLAWVITLPVAVACAAMVYFLARMVTS